MKLRIPQATVKGYIEVEEWGVFDYSYPESKTRRGRVQEGGANSTHHHLHRRDILIRTTLINTTMNLEQHYRTLVNECDALAKKIEINEAFIDNLCAEIQDPIEIELAKGKLLTMMAHLHNLNARIINLDRLLTKEKSNRESSQVCGDGIATSHCGQDIAPHRPIIDGPCIHIHKGNTTPNKWGCLKSLLGMEVIALTKAKCQSCPQDHYGTPCVKLELAGGTYICLASKHQDNA